MSVALDDTQPVVERLPDAASLDRRLVFAAVAGNLLGHDLAPVTVGRFVVLERLGSGNFGTVWLAFDPKLQRRIALKLASASVVDAPLRLRIEREAQAAAALSHPNVITVHDVGEIDDRLYIAMELVVGVTLAQWTRAAKRPWRQVVELFVRVADGLQAAHDAGVTHRDFKPDNVLVDREGRPRIVDFGLARAGSGGGLGLGPRRQGAPSQSTTSGGDGSIAGTPAYMAPEQFAGRDVGPKSDQFAFAVALFETLFGARPFAGRTIAELATAVTRGQRAPVVTRGVPQAVMTVLRRALAVDPSQRFGQMSDLRDALQRALARRGRVALGVGAAALAGLGLAAGVMAAPAADPCADVGDELVALYSPAQREQLARRPGSAAAAVLEDLDRYDARWRSARVDACEATLTRGEQSHELMDLRVACLAQRSVGFGALVTALLNEDEVAAGRVHAWLDQGVDALARCDDATWLRSDGHLHLATRTDRGASLAADAGWVEQVSRIDASRIEQMLGHYARARELAQGVADEAAAMGLRAIEADARIQLASLAMELGETDGVAASLDRAVALSLAAAPADTTIDALLRRVELDQRQGRVDGEANVRLDVAEALLARVPDDDIRRARVLEARGLVAQERGDMIAAQHLLELALELAIGAYEPGHANVDALRNNLAGVLLARGQNERARALWQEAIASTRARPETPPADLAMPVFNLGIAILRLGDLEAAVAQFAEARALWIDAFGPEHPLVALAQACEAEALRRAGELERARTLQEAALALRERTLGEGHPDVAFSLEELAEIDRAERHFADAHARLDRAYQLRLAATGPDHVDLAYTLVPLATLLCDEGRPADALAPITRALELRGRPGLDPARIPGLHAIALRAIVGAAARYR
ncbi:MAG: serine/threonine protein kinase [Deltaproteobacteria bacterium]|nr:serine/threonine protein kinase [Deltaproteobacteria bacterium]MBK8720373.1 serine/threonine protein kinase [Deltaproteobacteria bacterium]MBP7285486.1 serine/threonine protein kinase [Nannocystaceae bacterium]